MDAFRETFEWSFEGPLAEATGLPTAILYSVVLTITHAAADAIGQRLAGALGPVLGASRLRRRLFGQRLEFLGPPAVYVTWTGKRVDLRFGHRVKPNRLERVIWALATIPGARDPRLRGQRQRFAEAGSRGGTPLDG